MFGASFFNGIYVVRLVSRTVRMGKHMLLDPPNFLVNFYGTYDRGLVIIDITLACDLSCVFIKWWEKQKSTLGIAWENTAPGTEFPHIFCAGIGQMQLNVVLVILKITEG